MMMTSTSSSSSSSRVAGERCILCDSPLTNDIYITCAECTGVDLCLNCFADGPEIHEHRKSHSYRIVDTINYTPYVRGWPADEEIRLLRAIIAVGLDKWPEVASHLEGRSPQECKNHYYEVFIEGNMRHSPAGNGSSDVLPQSSVSRPSAQTYSSMKGATDGYMPSTSSTSSSKGRQPPIESNLVLGEDYAGFFPMRGDYKYEFNQHAEETLNDVMLHKDDAPVLADLKTGLLSAYHHAIAERVQHRLFAEQYGLCGSRDSGRTNHAKSKKANGDATGSHNLFDIMDEDGDHAGRTRTQQRIEVVSKFMRFHSASSHKELVDLIKKYGALQARRSQLRKLQKRGVIELPARLQQKSLRRLRRLQRNQRKDRSDLPSQSRSGSALRSSHLVSGPSPVGIAKKASDTSSTQESDTHDSDAPLLVNSAASNDTSFATLIDHEDARERKQREAAARRFLSREEAAMCEAHHLMFGTFLQVKKYLLINDRRAARVAGLSSAQFAAVASFLEAQGWRHHVNVVPGSDEDVHEREHGSRMGQHRGDHDATPVASLSPKPTPPHFLFAQERLVNAAANAPDRSLVKDTGLQRVGDSHQSHRPQPSEAQHSDRPASRAMRQKSIESESHGRPSTPEAFAIDPSSAPVTLPPSP